MAYFNSPNNFDLIMWYLGSLIDGVGYQYTYTSVPTDAATYASNVTWTDTKTQPTWSYIAPPSGAGWMIFDAYWQTHTSPLLSEINPVLATIAGSIPAVQVNSDWNSTTGLSKINNKPSLATVATTGAYADLTGKPSLAMVATSGAYVDLSGKPSLATVATTGAYADLTGKPAARSQSTPTRSLNSAFQPSTTQDSWVSYSVSCAPTISLTTGQTGTTSLQISSNNSTYTEISRFTNGNTGSLTIGLNLTQTLVGCVSGFVPAGYYVKLVTSGTATTTYVVGQEALL